MRIVEINDVNKGSTGNIMCGIAEVARAQGHQVLICYPHSRDNLKGYSKGDYLVGNRYLRNIGRAIAERVKSEHMIHISATLTLLFRLQRFNPDVVHIHNIHDSFLNIPLLFKYLRKRKIRVVWTLHDCWLYTGHCPYYIETGCYDWQTECKVCKYYRDYPSSFYDDASYKYHLKKQLLLSLGDNLVLVPVSKWLANEVSKSFLKNVSRQVISNGIDMGIFYPSPDLAIKKKFNIPKGKIILAAATNWGKRKGLPDYYKLAEMLAEDETIVLVGISGDMQKDLPKGIIGINRTDSKEELAKLYSIADVVLSLSYAETFGMTIIEANACGTPVVVYDNTAQPELVSSDNGVVVSTGDVKAVYQAVKTIFAKERELWRIKCRNSVVCKYNNSVSYQGYIQIFERQQ